MNTEQAQCLLGVVRDAPRKEIVSAHRRLVSTVHPDKCDGPEAGRLARQATEARDVLLAVPESPRQSLPSVETGTFVDADLLRHVRSFVDRIGGPVACVDLYRMLRGDLRACGLPAREARVCSACVLDDDFLAAGVARGFWELHLDGVRPVGWVDSPVGCSPTDARERAAPSAATGSGPAVARVVEEQLRLWILALVRWAAAVAAASMFWLAVVGCVGVLAGALVTGELFLAALAVPVVFVCVSTAVWILRSFDVDAGALGRPVVGIPGFVLSVAFFFLVVL